MSENQEFGDVVGVVPGQGWSLAEIFVREPSCLYRTRVVAFIGVRDPSFGEIDFHPVVAADGAGVVADRSRKGSLSFELVHDDDWDEQESELRKQARDRYERLQVGAT